MKNMTETLGNVWLRAAIGIALCALLIAFGGPYLGIGERQPLASVMARVVAIAVVAALWIGVVLLRQWLAARRSQRMGDALAAQDETRRDEIDARIQGERNALRARFIEALAVLRKRRAGGGNLEDLPWYVLIGTPGSGKSTLLEHSGLAFPLAAGSSKPSLPGVGGTRQCDWWFTDEAVFLDTAGRYTTQDSDPGVDAPAWDGFLQLLRRYRRRRPVNGVILTVSVAELLTMSAVERQRLAATFRERLDEIGTRLGMTLPVYLVFTKVDLVAGFLEFFDTLDAAGRAQVWGVTFPPERSIDGSAAGLIGEELEALLERIDAGMLTRIHPERDVRRRARILSLTQQLRHLRDLTLPLTGAVFGSHAYGRSPVLRGMYLTSGTQEGTPIDRVLSVVGRSFGMQAAGADRSRAPRRTFFVERLMKDVILPEAGFAGSDPVALRRGRVAAMAAIMVLGLLTAGMLVGLFTSAARNADVVARVERVLRDYPDDAHTAAPSSLRQYYAQALQRLDVLGRAEQVTEQVRKERPWSMRFGLFQGDALFDALRDAHVREVNASVVPGLALQFRDGLHDAAGDPQRLYYVLKGYLMLGEPEHRDFEVLSSLALGRWREVFPDEDGLADTLAGHFREVFDGGDTLRSFPIDAALVDAARASLRAADLATLIYGSLKIDSESRQDAPVRLDRTLGLLGGVFRRRSGAPLSKPFPALYTRPVFAAMVQEGGSATLHAHTGIAAAVDRFVKDDWVLGANAGDPLRRASLIAQVRTLYINDYIRAWDALIGDLQLHPVANVQGASDVAARLAGPSSPLKALLMLIRDNTADLLRKPVAASGDRIVAAAQRRAEEQVKSRSEVARIIAEGGVRATDGSAPSPDAPILEHFATLNQLTDGTTGAMPLDHVLGVLDQMSKTLLTLPPGTDNGGQPEPVLALARQEVGQLPPPLSSWLGNLVGSSQSLLTKGAHGALADGFRQAAGGDCSRFVQGRYPFAAGSRSDIPLQNFAELFGNGGRFDSFFRQTLSHAVDTSASVWTFHDVDGARAGGAMLVQAQLADAIRQAYFRDGAHPQVDFSLSVATPPQGIGRLLVEVDGQRLEYEAGKEHAPVAMRWPGPKPGMTRISAWDPSGHPLPVLEYRGEWGWFHALDSAGLQRRTETRFGVTFGFGDAHVALDIEASSLRNPFGDSSVRRFRCPA